VRRDDVELRPVLAAHGEAKLIDDRRKDIAKPDGQAEEGAHEDERWPRAGPVREAREQMGLAAAGRSEDGYGLRRDVLAGLRGEPHALDSLEEVRRDARVERGHVDEIVCERRRLQ
jgi:hypothetical protein